MRDTITVSLFGGPGCGKSTMAAGIFHDLKIKQYECEAVTEFAKYLTWEKNSVALGHQIYVTAKQMHREFVVHGQVDIIITDSPILLGLIYYNEKDPVVREAFERFVVLSFKSKRQKNYFVERQEGFDPIGRNHSHSESIEIDERIKTILRTHDIPFKSVKGNKDGIDEIVREVTSELTVA